MSNFRIGYMSVGIIYKTVTTYCYSQVPMDRYSMASVIVFVADRIEQQKYM